MFGADLRLAVLESAMVPQIVISRKFCSKTFPDSVMIDSGWNCMPSTERDLWRTPIIMPFSVLAVICSVFGILSSAMANE